MLFQNLFNIDFNNCLLNASGCCCSNLSDLTDLDNSESGGIVSKTCSIDCLEGNTAHQYFNTNLGAINSMGLPNLGHKFYIDKIGSFSKPYIVSVAANYLYDSFEILDYITDNHNDNVVMVEINVSCPVFECHQQLGYDFNKLNSFLFILSIYLKKKPNNIIIGLKLPPYLYPTQFNMLKNVVDKHIGFIRFLTTINSGGNGLVIDYKTETTVIKPNNGLCGIGGQCVKPIALANIWQLYRLFGDQIVIIGCGGISNGIDAFEHILCGASLCQVGNTLNKEGGVCFERIIRELKNVMREKGYYHISDFQGKLKTL